MLRHYSFPSLDLRGWNVIQHDSTPVRKGISMKTWCVKVGDEESECPARQSPPPEHLWDELELRLHLRLAHHTYIMA